MPAISPDAGGPRTSRAVAIDTSNARLIVFLAATLLTLAGAIRLPAQSLGPADGRGLAAADTGRVRPGMPAPDFTLESFTGPRVTLSQFRGQKIVLLAFYRGHW
jgi:cytochrome oxidase Cu insertion factor (SCO1/SenC/PrrC family)